MGHFEYDFMSMQKHFEEMGRKEPNLDDDTRMKRIVHLLYSNHIEDEDGYDVAEAAFQRGKRSLDIEILIDHAEKTLEADDGSRFDINDVSDDEPVQCCDCCGGGMKMKILFERR